VLSILANCQRQPLSVDVWGDWLCIGGLTHSAAHIQNQSTGTSCFRPNTWLNEVWKAYHEVCAQTRRAKCCRAVNKHLDSPRPVANIIHTPIHSPFCIYLYTAVQRNTSLMSIWACVWSDTPYRRCVRNYYSILRWRLMEWKLVWHRPASANGVKWHEKFHFSWATFSYSVQSRKRKKIANVMVFWSRKKLTWRLNVKIFSTLFQSSKCHRDKGD